MDVWRHGHALKLDNCCVCLFVTFYISSSNIYLGFCQIKKGQGNTIQKWCRQASWNSSTKSAIRSTYIVKGSLLPSYISKGHHQVLLGFFCIVCFFVAFLCCKICLGCLRCIEAVVVSSSDLEQLLWQQCKKVISNGCGTWCNGWMNGWDGSLGGVRYRAAHRAPC